MIANCEALPTATVDIASETVILDRARRLFRGDWCAFWAAGMVVSLFISEGEFAPEPELVANALGEDSKAVLEPSIEALSELLGWSVAATEQALRAALGLKPRKAFAPVRVAVTGRAVSPRLDESMELLDRCADRVWLARNGGRVASDRTLSGPLWTSVPGSNQY